MYKLKKVGAVLLTVTLLAASNVKIYAVTPQYRPPQTDFTIEVIVDAVKNYLKDNPINTDEVDSPQITKSIYYHKKLFFNKARLQIEWEKVEKAKCYKIKVIKQNGESKVYKSNHNSLFVYEKSDDFITGCVRGGKIKVKAIGSNGLKSDWSKVKMISCNSLH